MTTPIQGAMVVLDLLIRVGLCLKGHAKRRDVALLCGPQQTHEASARRPGRSGMSWDFFDAMIGSGSGTASAAWAMRPLRLEERSFIVPVTGVVNGGVQEGS